MLALIELIKNMIYVCKVKNEESRTFSVISHSPESINDWVEALYKKVFDESKYLKSTKRERNSSFSCRKSLLNASSLEADYRQSANSRQY